jgi:hypothetical protein
MRLLPRITKIAMTAGIVIGAAIAVPVTASAAPHPGDGAGALEATSKLESYCGPSDVVIDPSRNWQRFGMEFTHQDFHQGSWLRYYEAYEAASGSLYLRTANWC